MRSTEAIAKASFKKYGHNIYDNTIYQNYAIYEAMDEFAKEVHFAYKEWIDKIVRDGGEQFKKLKDVNDKELFNQFLESIKPKP
jgi:hypothetical protein